MATTVGQEEAAIPSELDHVSLVRKERHVVMLGNLSAPDVALRA